MESEAWEPGRAGLDMWSWSYHSVLGGRVCVRMCVCVHAAVCTGVARVHSALFLYYYKKKTHQNQSNV